MSQTNLKEFDDRLNSGECSQVIRDIVASLRKAAEQAGDIAWSAHSAPGRSWGIIGKRGGRVICRLDLKPQAEHVCVSIPGVDDSKLVAAGTVHRRKNAPSWVDIRDTRGASLLAPLIAVTSAAGRGIANPGAGSTLRGSGAANQDITRPGRSFAPRDQPVQPGGESESESGDVRDELCGHGFVQAGTICPVDSGRSCKFDPFPVAFAGRVVYALVVGGQLKKCGDTGRRAATIHRRMTDCVRTINDVLTGALPGPFTENFKNRAPQAIAANTEIEVWARQATEAECRWFQRHLNEKHDTIRAGWANRLE